MLAWLGTSWSAKVVPQASRSICSSLKRPLASLRTASAVSWALVWVALPVAGSTA